MTPESARAASRFTRNDVIINFIGVTSILDAMVLVNGMVVPGKSLVQDSERLDSIAPGRLSKDAPDRRSD
jgi:hypothetical protein